MSKKMVVAIDGHAGAGKSTSAKLVAQKLGYLYIDTGAMYRALTYWAILKNALDDSKAVTEIAEKSDIVLKFIDGTTQVTFNGEDITPFIRSQKVNLNVSLISKIERVREILVKKQREMAENNSGVVMEGRDIGSVVFPDADVKIFLTASIEQRALRRQKDYADAGIQISLDEIKSNLIQRDNLDSTRNISPLLKVPDAIEINTSDLTIDEQVEIILERVKEVVRQKEIKIQSDDKN
mgnify:CR=1 FL=1